ncbi:MAG: CotH kinase family protein [Eubacteriales bacterium]
MKKIISFILVLAMTLSLASCFDSIPQVTTPTGSITTTTGKNGGNGGSGSTTTTTTYPKDPDKPIEDIPQDPDQLADFYLLFNPENRVEIKLDIPDTELAKLQADYEKYRDMGSKSPIYRMADMYVKVTAPDGNKKEWTIEQVGVRMKGNTSRTDFYSDENGMYNLVHFKVSFGETFDKAEYYGDEALVWDAAEKQARKDRTFATLEKLELKWNRNDDETYIKEIYSYELYRESGVLAPYTALASVDIGSDHAGVWIMYEPVDKIFLEKRLPEEALGGDLYKLGWTYEGATFTSFSSYGIEDEDSGQFFIYDLKTNKKTSTHESLKALINTLNSNSLTKEKFESVVDMNNFINFSAVSYIAGNPDDLRNNYNNCYIYFRADTGKLMLIPYDMDRVFGINTWNPYGDSMTTDSPFMTYNVCGEQRNPLFKKTLCENGFFMDEYVAAIKAIDAKEMLTLDAFEERFNTANALYGDETTPSKTYNNAGGYNFRFDINHTCDANGNSNMSFADYMNAKRATMKKYIDGTSEPDNSGSGDNGGNGGNSGSGDNGGTTNPDDSQLTRPQLPDAKPDESFDLCIRADFTNWNVSDEYKLTKTEDGVFSITVTRSEEFRFKIHDSDDGKWYGAEWVDYDCTVAWEADSHTNIVLPAGTYTISFHTDTRVIYITQQ